MQKNLKIPGKRIQNTQKNHEKVWYIPEVKGYFNI